MRRILLDSNAVNPLALQPDSYAAVEAAVSSGRLEVLYTHVTRDEVGKTPAPERRASLVRLLDLGRQVDTAAFLFDVSHFDEARLGGDQESIDAVTTRGKGKFNDALMGVTAQVDGLTLVTNDGDLAKKAAREGIGVVGTDELLASL
jgi:predicted nucleic acid-binding protein